MSHLMQQFDEVSFTYTYILMDSDTHEAVIIDPVDTKLNGLINFVNEKKLTYDMC